MKICVLILFTLAVTQLTAQEKFILTANVNSGIYFSEETILSYNIENGLQFGVGSQLNYFINQKIKIGLGVNYNYIKSSDNDYYWPVRLMPDLSAIEIPFTLQRDFLKNWFITADAAVFWHTGSIKPTDGALGKCELGTGYRFKNLAVSMNYSQNFKNHDIRIESENSSSF